MLHPFDEVATHIVVIPPRMTPADGLVNATFHPQTELPPHLLIGHVKLTLWPPGSRRSKFSLRPIEIPVSLLEEMLPLIGSHEGLLDANRRSNPMVSSFSTVKPWNC